MKTRLSLVALALGIILASGCERRHSHTVSRTNVQSSSFLMDHTAFNLGLVTQMVKANKVKNAQELEELVNSDNGINNVDLDKDGQIDYIAVRESETNRGNLDFIAYPATKGESGATTIAQLSITRNTTTNQVVVSGGYPDYVSGYDSHYYTHSYHGPSLGQVLFLNYMLNASRPRYYHPYTYYRSRPAFRTVRRVYTPSRLRTARTTYRTRVKVKPARIVKRPKTYTIKSASKTKSRLRAKRATGSGLSGRRGTTRTYKQRNNTRPKPKGSAFGRTKPKTTYPRKTTKPRSSSGWNSGSGRRRATTPKRRATPRRSGWNSGSGRRRSSGSRSRSRSRRRGR